MLLPVSMAANVRRAPAALTKLAVLLSVLGGASWPTHASDLLEAYHHALQNDPSLRGAQYRPKIARQNRWRALGATLPQVNSFYEYSLTDTRQPERANPDGSVAPALDYSYNTQNYGISVDQVLFDYRAFVAFREIKFGQVIAEQQLVSVRTQTILNVVEAYFRQLMSNDDLQLARAELEALSIQLQAAKLRLELGADSKISVQQIQARHDQARARVIVTRNDHQNAKNQLWALTLKSYDHLASAKNKPPIHEYQPNDVKHWVRLALSQNPQVSEALATSERSRYHRRRVNGSYWPRIDLNYQYGRQDVSGTDRFEALFLEGTNSRIGVRVNFPLFAGGSNIAQSRIAAFEYQASRENEQLVRRRVENDVVQLWNNHAALRSVLDAREAALLSSTTSLELIRQGKVLGNNSTSDLLDAVKDRYQAQRDFVAAIYNYLFNQVRFEAAVGALNTDTIMRLNSLLEH